MKKIQTVLSACFHKKHAEKEISASEPVNNPKAESKDACCFTELGLAEYPLFTPQPLMQFYAMYKTYQTLSPTTANIGQVQLLELWHPQKEQCMATVFAIKDEDVYLWGEIASQKVKLSSDTAFIYKPVDRFEVPMCRYSDGSRVMARCKYNKGSIKVVEIYQQHPDGKKEKMHCSVLPCTLREALEFLGNEVKA